MPPKLPPPILVIGAGVSGLTTAVCLAEAGYPVRIRTARPPLQTTSCSAGALWGPFLLEDPRLIDWCHETRRVLRSLAGERAGIRIVAGVEAATRRVPPPRWATEIEGYTLRGPDDLPAGFVTGWAYTAPVVDMPVYLAYLCERFVQRGQIEAGTVASLADAVAEAPIVVNCTGYGARRLVPDPMLRPIRGQLLVVDNPGIDEFFADAEVDGEDPSELTYILPQGDRVVLGGTAQPGRRSLRLDRSEARRILERCVAVNPLLAKATVREHRVGVRPSRRSVRVERVELNGGHVIHNYGHGGSGVTLSWGCAAEVLRLVQDVDSGQPAAPSRGSLGVGR
ncbi:FAD-dependent oxidoreductase [Phytohabitans sp. ZYX-F-186]|uniref:D-amino-acid oxidase n=1 Tax=Phytohabitans maris TaxID=3071409 RepID=A0ABU0ZB35_9ACTN|nr:FAD-dependent oxidoreductase [Phytohabitans sp. ZYX-F-186]MDQ7904278.1 FAD-dependent oxidoreductase [Phytohabitans sp. ZYX-F-186]